MFFKGGSRVEYIPFLYLSGKMAKLRFDTSLF